MTTKDTPQTSAQTEMKRALQWVFGNDTGQSSMTIAAVMLNLPPASINRPSIPYDAGDLGRCLRLLERLPEWRARLDEVASAFPQWRPLVENWTELERLYADEARDLAASGTAEHRHRMDRTYHRINELID